MQQASHIPRVADMLEAILRLKALMQEVPLEAFERDWQRQWLVERGAEIISEASRHLPEEMKARYIDIPWRKVAGIGNVLRHNYENIAAPVMWALVREDLPPLERVCREELARVQATPKPLSRNQMC